MNYVALFIIIFIVAWFSFLAYGFRNKIRKAIYKLICVDNDMHMGKN